MACLGIFVRSMRWGPPDERSDTALNSAVLNGCDQYVRMLIEAGANVNTRDAQSRTPLICAAEN